MVSTIEHSEHQGYEQQSKTKLPLARNAFD